MGECLPSGTLIYDEAPGRSTLTVEFWDRDFPEAGNEPCVNVTAEDHTFGHIGTAGLNFEQVRALHASLGRWIAADAPPAEAKRRPSQ